PPLTNKLWPWMRNTSPLMVQPPFDQAPFIGSRILSPRSDWPTFMWSVTDAAVRACAVLDRPRHSKTPQDRRPTTFGIVAMGASLVRCKNTTRDRWASASLSCMVDNE